MLVDIYKFLPEDYFEQIGDFSDDEEEYAPVDYDDVCTALYTANSFYGPEMVDLFVDHESKVYYIRSAIRQPIGDYAWTTVWAWYKSLPEYYEEIKAITDDTGMKQTMQEAEDAWNCRVEKKTIISARGNMKSALSYEDLKKALERDGRGFGGLEGV